MSDSGLCQEVRNPEQEHFNSAFLSKHCVDFYKYPDVDVHFSVTFKRLWKMFSLLKACQQQADISEWTLKKRNHPNW